MSLPTVIAENQTASPVTLTRLGLTVPASSTLTLTDFAFVDEIKQDESLHAAIVANSILLNLGQGTLSKGDSLKFFVVVTLEVRRSVRALSDANVASLSGPASVDSVSLVAGDRVLLTAQSTASQNGIWVVQTGAWTRPSDFNTGDSAAGAIIMVQEGTNYGGQTWNITSIEGSDTIGTNNLAAAALSGAGSDTLQTAYDNGATITTAGAVDIAFTLTSGNFTVNGGGLIDFGGTTPLSSFNLDTSGNITIDSSTGSISLDGVGASNFTTASGNLSLASTTTGSVLIDGVDGVEINSSAGALQIGNDANTGAINIGTGAAARTITIGNVTGATQIDMNSGTGGTLIDSTGVISLDGVGASNFTTDSGNLTLSTTTSGAVNVSSAGAVDVQAVGNVTIDSSGGTIGMGTDADTGAINIGTGAAARVITIGNNTGATGVAIETGTGNLLVDAPLTTLTGNLLVEGTTTTVHSEIVNIADNFLYLNADYTTASAEEGGIVVNYLPTSTNDTVASTGFVARAGAVNAYVYVTEVATTIAAGSDGQSLPQATINVADTTGFAASGTVYVTTTAGVQTVTYTGTTGTSFTGCTGGTGTMNTGNLVSSTATAIVAGDFIQVSGAADQTNDGLYEVLSNANGVLSIKGLGTTPGTYRFTQNDFVTDTTVQGTITKVTVAAIQVDATGTWQVGSGSDSASLTFTDIALFSDITLQNAYVGGNTITTSSGEGVLIIAGDQSMQVTATGGINLDTQFDADVTVFDVQMTGSNGFSIDGTAASNVTVTAGNLTLSTVTSGSVLVDGVDGVEINSTGGSLQIGNDANTGAINIGTGAAARVITIGNTTGATGVDINSGTEKVEIDGVTYYGAGAGLPTATGSGFQDGDKYYDTNLDMEMRYDAGRSKWLSVETMMFHFGRDGNTNTGQYYRAADGRVMSSTEGWTMPYAGTIIGLGYTRTDTDAATFDVVEGGVSRATLASSATSGVSSALDGNFSANGIIAVANQAGGNITSNVIGWVRIKFRSV